MTGVALLESQGDGRRAGGVRGNRQPIKACVSAGGDSLRLVAWGPEVFGGTPQPCAAWPGGGPGP